MLEDIQELRAHYTCLEHTPPSAQRPYDGNRQKFDAKDGRSPTCVIDVHSMYIYDT